MLSNYNKNLIKVLSNWKMRKANTVKVFNLEVIEVGSLKAVKFIIL